MTTKVKVTCACGAIYEGLKPTAPPGTRRLLSGSYVKKDYSRATGIMSDSYALYGALTQIESNAINDRRSAATRLAYTSSTTEAAIDTEWYELPPQATTDDRRRSNDSRAGADAEETCAGCL